MSKLYRDILYLIFEELQYEKETLASCLAVNKTWCETVIPVLWKDPWGFYINHEKKKLLLNTIISHLADETRNGIKKRFIYFTSSYKKPLFNYISFCKHLNLEILEGIIKNIFTNNYYEEIKNDILDLFINENMEYTHLYISKNFDYNFIPGAELCFSKIEYLKIDDRVDNNILSILTKICKSIKELKISINESEYNYGIAKLIENQKNLINISFLNDFSNDKSSREIIENSLVKHSNTIQYFSAHGQLETKVLSSFVNLKMLELIGNYNDKELEWDNIRDLSLPSLQTLNAINIPINCLTNLIESSGRQFTKIYYYSYFNDVFSNKKLIQTICHNCPNLVYLELLYKNENIVDLERLLINCQNLKRLDFYYNNVSLFCRIQINNTEWDNLFNILAKSSPPSLFEFIFKYTDDKPGLESLKLFFDNWEGRHPVSLKFETDCRKVNNELIDLIGRYKEKGVVKKFVYYSHFHKELDLSMRCNTKKVIRKPETKSTTSIWNRLKMLFN